MNLSKWAIIFTLITLPPIWIHCLEDERKLEVYKNQIFIERALDSAMKDGIMAMAYYQDQAYYGDEKHDLKSSGLQVIAAFMTSYQHQFQAISAQDRIRNDQYLMAVLVLSNEGYYIRNTDLRLDISNKAYRGVVISELQPYKYEDEQFLISMTWGDQVTMIDKQTLETHQGSYNQLTQWTYTDSSEAYERMREEVIHDNIEEALIESVYEHNLYARRLGFYDDFHMPLGEGSLFERSINGPGLLVVCQGMPLGKGQVYEGFFFEKSTVMKREEIAGYENPTTHQRSYCDVSCPLHGSDDLIQIFASKQEAAAAGYYPVDH